MSFNPTICSDCQYPPNFIVSLLPKQNSRQFFSVKCRDCNDSWQEYVDDQEANNETES